MLADHIKRLIIDTNTQRLPISTCIQSTDYTHIKHSVSVVQVHTFPATNPTDSRAFSTFLLSLESLATILTMLKFTEQCFIQWHVCTNKRRKKLIHVYYGRFADFWYKMSKKRVFFPNLLLVLIFMHVPSLVSYFIYTIYTGKWGNIFNSNRRVG